MYGPLTIAVSILLLLAAWRDIVMRTIPDVLPLLIVAAGLVSRLAEGASATAASAGAALLLFCLLLAGYSRGFLGGGDVKLMTALAIGLSPLNSYRFVIATAIVGGVLGALYLLLSRIPYPLRRFPRRTILGRVLAIEAGRIRRRASLPYGVAIAAGGIFILFHSGVF